MPEKDYRYLYTKSIWKAGDLKSFLEIFNIIPISIIAEDLNMNYRRLKEKINNPRLFIFKEIERLSVLTEINFCDLVALLVKSIEEDEKFFSIKESLKIKSTK